MTSNETEYTDKQQSMMSRIMKLLERANHPSTPPDEAALCNERAERLMAQHMIDRMDLKAEDKAKIISTTWDINVGSVKSNDTSDWNDYGFTMVNLAMDILKHCNIRPQTNTSYKKVATELDGVTKTDYSIRVVTLVGYPEDIAYADRIWFNVYKAFVTNINPTWQPEAGKLGENVHNFQSAGYKWPEIWQVAWRHQQQKRKDNPNWSYINPATLKMIPVGDPASKTGYSGLKQSVRDYHEQQGTQYQRHTQRHQVYRSSFVQSFTSTIRHRLSDIRAEAMRNKTGEDNVDNDRYALAVVDTKEQIDREYYRLFPDEDPEVQRRKHEERMAEAQAAYDALSDEEKAAKMAAALAAEARRQQQEAKDSKSRRRNYGAVRTRTVYADEGAWARGRSVAQKVNLRNDGEVKKEQRGELA